MGIPGSFSGWFKVVTNIAIGPKGDIFAADFYNNRIQKFRADGTFLTSFGRKGSGPGQLDHAIAVAVADVERYLWSISRIIGLRSGSREGLDSGVYSKVYSGA